MFVSPNDPPCSHLHFGGRYRRCCRRCVRIMISIVVGCKDLPCFYRHLEEVTPGYASIAIYCICIPRNICISWQAPRPNSPKQATTTQLGIHYLNRASARAHQGGFTTSANQSPTASPSLNGLIRYSAWVLVCGVFVILAGLRQRRIGSVSYISICPLPSLLRNFVVWGVSICTRVGVAVSIEFCSLIESVDGAGFFCEGNIHVNWLVD